MSEHRDRPSKHPQPESPFGDDPSTAVTDIRALQSLKQGERWVLSLLSGESAGKMFTLAEGKTILGRGTTASIQEPDDSLSREHAAFILDSGILYVQDLGSTNGTFVDGERLNELRRVEPGARLQLGLNTLVRASRLSEDEIEAIQKLWASSIQDSLTGVSNRRYLDQRLDAEFSFSSRNRRPLSLLMLDIDRFKSVNDQHGHQAGDAVLSALGTFLMGTVRSEDLVARFGGEEFVLLLRDQDAGSAQVVAERIRAQVEAMRIEWDSKELGVTVSIGAASHEPSRPYSDINALLAAADSCLYRAKRAGRNLVISDCSPRSVPPLSQ